MGLPSVSLDGLHEGLHASCAEEQFFALLYAALDGDTEAVGRLLSQPGIDPNRGDEDGFTPLFVACQEGHLEIARLLRDAGAGINQAMNCGTTPLFIASQEGQLECVRLLLEAVAAIDQADEQGATPLFAACEDSHLEVAKLLSSYGASRAATPFGTPKEAANREGHADLAAWLVASRGWTPLAHLETLTAARATRHL